MRNWKYYDGGQTGKEQSIKFEEIDGHCVK